MHGGKGWSCPHRRCVGGGSPGLCVGVPVPKHTPAPFTPVVTALLACIFIVLLSLSCPNYPPQSLGEFKCS